MSKFFVFATITYATLIQNALTKEISGKVGWLKADTNADGVISFIEFEERDQFDTGPRDKDGDGFTVYDGDCDGLENLNDADEDGVPDNPVNIKITLKM